MDYRELAMSLFSSRFFSAHRAHYQPISESSKGENFVLQLLCEREVVLSSEIASSMHITTARVASLLNQLQKKGYIQRQTDESDRRRVIVKITKEGRARAESQLKLILDRAEELLSDLGEQDATEFIRILGRIQQNSTKHFRRDCEDTAK
ncbi:MAG: transcriptional regulator [Oscillospiraceae bacterium]